MSHPSGSLATPPVGWGSWLDPFDGQKFDDDHPGSPPSSVVLSFNFAGGFVVKQSTTL
jgi:hypothetical protein